MSLCLTCLFCRSLLVATATGRLEILPVLNIKQRRLLKGHLGKVLSCCWSYDDRHLVSSSQDGRVIVWDAFTANKVNFISSLVIYWFRTLQLFLFYNRQTQGTHDYHAHYLGNGLCLCSVRNSHRQRVSVLIFQRSFFFLIINNIIITVA